MPYNPFYFFNSPLAMEKIEKLLVEYKNQQLTIDQLTQKVNSIEDVEPIVVEQIQKMYDDGTLSSLIDEIVKKNIPVPDVPNTTTIDFSQIARTFHIAHRYGYAPSGERIDNTYDAEHYSYAQGNTVAVINGVKYWIIAYVSQNKSHFDTANSGAIYVYRFINDDRLEYVSRVFVSAVGHMNGLTYQNGYVYITPNSYAGEGGGATTDVIRYAISEDGVIDASTKEVKTADVYASGSRRFTDHICSYNNELFFVDGELNIYKYDWDTNVSTLIYNRILGEYDLPYSGDGLSINDKYIYVGHGRDRRIYRFNREAEKIDVAYQYPKSVNNYMYKCGEIEGFTIIDDIIYALSTYNLGANLYTNDFNVTRFYRQNINTNGIPATNDLGGWTSGSTNVINLYVAGDLPTDTQNPSNPTGLTEDNAFQSVQEALDYIEGNEWIKRAKIIVLQQTNQSSIYVKTTKPIEISGVTYKNRNNGTRPVVGYINSNGVTIKLNSLGVRAIFPSDVFNATGIHTAIHCSDNIASCIDIYIPGGFNSNPAEIIYGYEAVYGLLNVYIPATTEENWASRGENYKICNTYNSTVNSHGNFTKNINIIN